MHHCEESYHDTIDLVQNTGEKIGKHRYNEQFKDTSLYFLLTMEIRIIYFQNLKQSSILSYILYVQF